MATIETYREDELEAAPCPKCGSGNALDGAKLACDDCTALIDACAEATGTDFRDSGNPGVEEEPQIAVRGLKGKDSPMRDPNTTEAQRERILALVEQAKSLAESAVRVRYSTYIGPGCAAERGDLTVDVDGHIWRMVTRGGNAY